jgi:hypothetical protein
MLGPHPAPMASTALVTDPDCGQSNSPGADRCQYCGTALTRPSGGARHPHRAAVPVGRTEPLVDSLRIGRNPSFSLLARRLHPRFDNVSNRHAELTVRGRPNPASSTSGARTAPS